MKAMQILGLTLMGYAVAPTPDDVAYTVPPVGIIKDGLMFAVGLGLFLWGSKR